MPEGRCAYVVVLLGLDLPHLGPEYYLSKPRKDGIPYPSGAAHLFSRMVRVSGC